MTSTIVLPSARFLNSKEYVFPISEAGLEYFNFFDSGANFSRNLVKSKAGARIVGAPVERPGYAIMRPGSNFIETSTLITGERTYILACRSPAAAAQMIGAYKGGSGADRGDALFVNTTGSIVASVTQLAGGGVYSGVGATGSVGSAGQWRVVALRANAAAVDGRDLATMTGSTSPLTGILSPNVNVARVGGDYSTVGSSTTTVDIAAAFIASRMLSDAELALMFQRIRLTLELNAIAV